MTVQVATDNQFTFVAGLNSEANYFTFPKNAWKSGDNVYPTIGGTVRKRVAVDLEQGFGLSSASLAPINVVQWAFSSHKWLSVAGNGDRNFLVAQVGRYVWFYSDTSAETSNTLKTFTIDLNTYKPSSNPSTIGTHPIKTASANGKLLITSLDTNPILVSYDVALDDITVEEITIEIRDFVGLDDGLTVDNKPATLSDSHKYNLYNQGWGLTNINAYFAAKSVYPSNAQTWIHGKDSSDNFDSNVLDKQDFGTSPAPKGRYVLNAFDEDRATASGIVGIAKVTEYYRPKTCAFFAGRAWYAGIISDRLGGTVWFSQVALDTSKYGKCYQDADPTSEVLSDLVDSDGGALAIQDCGEIQEMRAMENGIVIFATNGIWHIIGTSSNGFTATGYEVKKVSNNGCVGPHSVVEVDNGFLFWNHSGIMRFGGDAVGGYKVESITDLSIKTLYNDIPPLAKQYVSGAYNTNSKTVYWLYNVDLTSTAVEYPYKKTNVLALDLRLGAFYTFSFSTESGLPFITDVIVTKETNIEDVSLSVSAGDDLVITALSDSVVADYNVSFTTAKQYKFFTVVPNSGTYEMSWADLLTLNTAPTKFYDWYGFNNVGVSFDAYVETGWAGAPNGPDKKKQAMYITTYCERTETGFTDDFDPINESSCTMYAKWDFTDSNVANKWTSGQEVYRHIRPFYPNSTTFDDGYPLVITKNKVRGRGRALQLRFEADTDKDMRLAGWSTVLVGGTNV